MNRRVTLMICVKDMRRDVGDDLKLVCSRGEPSKILTGTGLDRNHPS